MSLLNPMVVYMWIDCGEGDNLETVYCRIFHETDGITNWKVAYPIRTEGQLPSSTPVYEHEIEIEQAHTQ